MRISLMILLVFVASSSGCSMLEWAAPHQLWKLNRQPAGGRNDPYFSVPAQPAEPGGSSASSMPSVE